MASTTCPSSRMSGRSGCSACARPRVRRAPGPGSVSGSDGCPPGIGLAAVRQLVRVQPNRSSASRGRPARMPRQRTAAFSTRGLRESASTAALALTAFEEEDDLALADKDVVSLEPQALKVEGRPLLDELAGRFGRATLDRNNDRNAGPRRPLGPEASEQIGELAEQAHPAQRGDEHPLTGVPLEHERLVAVDPLIGCAPDLRRGELVEGNSELVFAPPVQDEVVGAQLELAAGGRTLPGAPDGGVLVTTLVNAFGRQDRSFPIVQTKQ